MHLTLQTFSVILDVVMARKEVKSGDSGEKKNESRGKFSDSGIASLIEFYGNVAYISTFSFAAAKEIREATEKLF